MNYPKIRLAQTLIQLCKAKNISHIVISPGSRNAPLTLGFGNDPFFNCYSIVDERCAAFFALGMAQQRKEPVAVVCTSGSALLNYYPAISEAFYSDIPLIVISADRPSDKIDIGDGQTIRQVNVFANHILYEANLSEVDANQNENERKINEAINTAMVQRGPVHINAPFEEPLYELIENFEVNPKVIHPVSSISSFDLDQQVDFIDSWNLAQRKMILVGSLPVDSVDRDILTNLASDDSVVVFTETTSNIHHPHFFPGIDVMIAPIEKIPEELEKLRPDMLITFGGMIVSKKIKAFLRIYKPQRHFHIDPKTGYDTFFCLTHHFKSDVSTFFNKVHTQLEKVPSDYQSYWLGVQELRRKSHKDYIAQIPFSDFKVYESIFKSLPEDCMLQLSNSSTIRYAQLFPQKESITVFCNRGTSGIDGSTSTAIGASMVVNRPTVFVTGDLSFFYDSNALWNRYTPSDFRIIIINNAGGGIFRILPGPKNTPVFDSYFETVHNLSANHLCEMYGWDYKRATDENSLHLSLSTFYSTGDKPKVLEVFTPRLENDEILLKYFSF